MPEDAGADDDKPICSETDPHAYREGSVPVPQPSAGGQGLAWPKARTGHRGPGALASLRSRVIIVAPSNSARAM